MATSGAGPFQSAAPAKPARRRVIAVLGDPRPFAREHDATLVLPHPPDDHPERAASEHMNLLISREIHEMEAEVGARVSLSHDRAINLNGPAILIGPSHWNPTLRDWRTCRQTAVPSDPFVAIDCSSKRVVVEGDTVEDVGGAMQLLRTAIADRVSMLTLSTCTTADEVVRRLDTEVRRTFPELAERAPDWETAVQSARAAMQGEDDLPTVQRLMARLHDAHSWAKDSRLNGRLPYQLHDNGDVTRFWSIPPTSMAWQHGIRPGDLVTNPSTAPLRDRTGATPRTLPWVTGYRAMQGRAGEAATFEAIRRDGTAVTWAETVPAVPWDQPIDVDRLDQHTGYIRIRGWLNTSDWHDAFVSALEDMVDYDRLVVDLRGNVGGALVAAQDARTRFLSERTLIGTIQYSTALGTMDEVHEIYAEPAAIGPRWTKPVRFVTDPQTYSAAEDFLQGLQGLPHVQLIGQATGGGSGRPRTIALRPNIVATISTALTFDRAGRCIEGNGLAPDILVEPDPRQPDAVMDLVLQDWSW